MRLYLARQSKNAILPVVIKDNKLKIDSCINVELDATGLDCPMPLLKLKQQLNKMSPGQIIRVKTTDAGSVRDFEAFVSQIGHDLMLQEEAEGVYTFIIKKEN